MTETIAGSDRTGGGVVTAMHLRWAVRIALGISWGAFLLSFFLPAVNSLETAGTPLHTTLLGWQAAKLLFYFPLAFAFPRILVLFPVIFIANVVAFFSPLGLIDRFVALCLAACLGTGVVCAICVPEQVTGDLFVGYYIWIGSLLSMALVLGLTALGDNSTE